MNKFIIDGIKLIYHNIAGVDEPGDPITLPFKLALNLKASALKGLSVSFYTGKVEEIVVHGARLEALHQFLERNKFRTNPRLINLVIIGPDDEILEQIPKKSTQ